MIRSTPSHPMATGKTIVVFGLLSLVGLTGLFDGCSRSHPAAATPSANPAAWTRPEAARIPHTPEGDSIRLGKQIFDETPKYASANVGNRVACSDCHIQSGKAAYAAPMVDVPGLFPMFNKRAGHVISLQERIQECFVRSENGSPPQKDSKEMKALMAYITWLSPDDEKGEIYPGQDFVKLPELAGNPKHGEAVYAQQCAGCHGSNGAGVPPILPPVWGTGSYNDGAGMNDPYKMAAFLFHNMPQNHPGTLSPQDAYDVAAFIHGKPRPKLNPAYKHY
ncbi:MAG TPA: c-type cytochrome [Acidobacteriaceae bacterium]|nr:c-type cytochrome [Acidobacteriaceae bacterium]